jgi:hypothetical protein
MMLDRPIAAGAFGSSARESFMQIAASERLIAQGVLLSRTDEVIELGLPGTDYRLHLKIDEPISVATGKTIRGHLHARARRVDTTSGGGRYIEPVYGRPRRLQGRVVCVDAQANTIGVQCGCPFICVLGAGQEAASFAAGDFVTFDVERGARFEAQAMPSNPAGTVAS